MKPVHHGQHGACTGCHPEVHGFWHCRATRARMRFSRRGLEPERVLAHVPAAVAMAAASRANLAGLRMKCVQYRTPSTKGSGAAESITMGRSRCTGCVRICRENRAPSVPGISRSVTTHCMGSQFRTAIAADASRARALRDRRFRVRREAPKDFQRHRRPVTLLPRLGLPTACCSLLLPVTAPSTAPRMQQRRRRPLAA
jgi:hypothetical protein